MTNLTTFIGTGALMATLTFGAVFPADAEACRDCPFPMGSGRWVTANGNIEIDILELPLTKKHDEIFVTLKMRSTGEIIARGSSLLKHGEKLLEISLADDKGHPIYGSISYLDANHERIQAKFKSEDREISDLFNERVH